ncbi:hypothetical protein BCR42DRAFT_490953 [Absidia repens]|uniref:Uncharacterized protein n=1 Tax=Absidia repens TaxID=90262 RepID=A0A1X2IJP4_9FUNG|nr:hypothetical protein BCR42DRAFT_490953 [Absidia repens]
MPIYVFPKAVSTLSTQSLDISSLCICMVQRISSISKQKVYKLVVTSLPSVHQQQYHHQHIVAPSRPSSPIIFDSNLLPTTGHTTHMIANALVSFFGKPDQPSVTIVQTEYSPPSILLPYMLPSSSSPLQQRQYPSRRYAHTTTVIKSKNSTMIFLIGGSTIEDDIPQSDIWKLDWNTRSWTNLEMRTNLYVPGLMGHVTIVLPRPLSTELLTCFGATHQHHAFSQECALFNADTLTWKPLKHRSPVMHPAPRIYASMISTNDTHAILYGGQSASSILLGDLWWLRLDDVNTTVNFIPLTHSIPRAGHNALMLSETRMLVHGGQCSESSGQNGTMIFDLDDQSSLFEFSNGNQHSRKRQLTLRSSVVENVAQISSRDGDGDTGISGGAIGGIIVAVIIALGVSIILFVFYQRRRRRQRTYDLHSRAVRFSLSTPPRPSESHTEQRSSIIQQPDSAKTRISHMSFGSEFGVGYGGADGSRSSISLPVNSKKTSTFGNVSTISVVVNSDGSNNHPNLLDSPSRQLYTNWVCETPMPAGTPMDNSNSNNTRNIDPRHTSLYINQSTLPDTTCHDQNENDTSNIDAKKGSSAAFERLRLSIFKPLDIASTTNENKNNTTADPSQHQEQISSSSSFQNQPISTNASGATTNDTEDSHGFNSEMDFNGNLTSRHLAVMNHRQSSATISSGSGFSSGLGGAGSVDDLNSTNSRPTSPRSIVAMAQQLQQQHRQMRQQHQQHSTYQLSQRELQSWEEARMSRLINPSMHRLITTSPSKTNNSHSQVPSLT